MNQNKSKNVQENVKTIREIKIQDREANNVVVAIVNK